MSKINRNAPCPCGSGKKYKKCCMKKDEEARDKIMNPHYIFKHASEYPLEFCKINSDWKEHGLASIIIVRKIKETGKYLFASILCDIFCLGVKNAFSDACVDWDLIEELLSKMPLELIPIDYEKAREIVLGSIEFARKIGFEPHKDWDMVREFVEWDKPCEINMKFGKNGKPLYIMGPFDDNKEVIKKIKSKNIKIESDL